MPKKVFIIEDDEDIRRNLQEFLGDEGYLVEVAENGKLGLERLQASADLPSVIILDLMMPGMNGLEFRKYQEADPRLALIPVIVMTADANAEAKKYRVGAKALITKPLNIKDILSVLKDVV